MEEIFHKIPDFSERKSQVVFYSTKTSTMAYLMLLEIEEKEMILLTIIYYYLELFTIIYRYLQLVREWIKGWRKVKVMGFVSESLSRFNSGVDGSDFLPKRLLL